MLMGVALLVVALPLGMNLAYAGDGGASGLAANAAAGNPPPAATQTWYANSPQPDPLTGLPNASGKPIRKFVTRLPGLGPTNANEIGQYVPIANADKKTFPGSDYYKIGIVEYSELMHPDLPKKTKLRGYLDLSSSTNTPCYLGPMIIAKRNRPVRLLVNNQLPTGAAGNLFIPTDATIMGAGMGPDGMHYYTQNRTVVHLHGGFTPWISDGTPHQWTTPSGETGPFFNKAYNPFRNFKGVSFQNVPDMVGSPGRPIPAPKQTDGLATYFYTNAQSARLMFYHDHAYGITRLNVYGGMAAPYLLTDSTEDGLINSGLLPNQGGGVYNYGIPLVIQDKTFIPNDIATQDATWGDNTGIPAGTTPNWGKAGDLWFPHKYEPNQDPTVDSGASLFGRWDYGPWFWPPTPTTTSPAPAPGVTHLLPTEKTDFSNPWVYSGSAVPEAFMDTPVVNGNPYPYYDVDPKAYRFRLLNACNDRMLNLSLFVADTGGQKYTYTNGAYGAVGSLASATAAVASAPTPGPVTSLALTSGGTNYTSTPNVYIYGGGGTGAAAIVALNPSSVASIAVTNGGTGYISAPTVTITGGGLIATGVPATATATVTNGSVTAINFTPGSGYTTAPLVSITGGGGFGTTAMAGLTPGPIASITLTDGGSGYTSLPTVLIGSATEVKMVEACSTAGWPTTWPTDGRDGGVPDPATRGPNVVQAGTEGGFLAAPALVPSQPVNYDYNRRDIVVLNVSNKALFTGPAERADFILDFSAFAGKTVILYNDAPAPVPAFDPRNDYYTGCPDQLVNGGAATTLPGYGPNTRTIMQFRVANTPPSPTFNLAALQAPTGLPAAFATSQPKPIVPEPGYGAAYGQTFTPTYSRIQSTSLTFKDFGNYFPGIVPINGKKTVPMQPKAIQELFDDFGRMNAILGVELPLTNILTQTTLPFQYIDPPTEGGDPTLFPGAVPITNGQTQIWKITHNGVDTHAIHIHLVNWQIINRVGWDGMIRPPDANEIGWKETVRMHPLEDCIVAAHFKLPKVPFTVPHSRRLFDVTMPPNTTAQFSGFDALGNPLTVSNQIFDFGWEYVWHCHLLGHEENDMMRAIAVTP
jgi:FtsP/CotA-like multicopper oxidase with cupredoxin domain